MEFIDRTGHIFSLPSYDTYPTGYEYETFDYIFYLEDEYVRRLSVNNYYIKPVRVLLHKDSGAVDALSIKVDSSVFRLIGSKAIQEKTKTGTFNIEFDEDDDPQLSPPRHLSESIEVEIKDAAQEVHGFQRRREGKSYLLLR